MDIMKVQRNISTKAVRLTVTRIQLCGFLLSLLCYLAGVTVLRAEVLIPLYVDKGTNLIKLTRTYCTSEYHWKELAKINNLSDPYTILAGDILYAPVELVKTEKVVARIASVIGGVFILQQDKSLKRIHKGDTILPGQTIVTEEDGFAHLIFPDNKYTRIASNSKFSLTYLIRLIDNSLKAEFFLERGRITHAVKKQLKDNETFSTRTPVSVTGVRGTEYRLKIVSNESNIVETLSGAVQLSSTGKTLRVGAGEGIVVEKGKELPPPKKLPQVPIALVVEDVYRELPVLIAAPSNISVDKFRLRLTKDLEGTETILEVVAAPGETFRLLALPDGEYFSFLTAIDKNKLESPPASPVLIRVRTVPGPPIFKRPLGGKIIFDDGFKQVWLGQEQAVRYFVQLATDNEFTSVVTEKTQKEVVYEAKNLSPGKYFLRVRSIAADGFVSLYSLTDSFEIRKTPSLEGFQGSFEDGVNLKWAAMGEGIVYELQISKDEDFNQLSQYVKGLQTPDYELMDGLEAGTYYVRVRGVIPGGQISPWTPYQVLKIPQPSFGFWDGAVLTGFLSLFLL